MDKTCTVDGCERPPRARGWCSMHYLRWFNSGKTITPVDVEKPVHTACTVDGCGRPPRTLHALYCEPHNARLRRTGDVQADVPIGAHRSRPVWTLCRQCFTHPTTATYCSTRCAARAARGIDEGVTRECLECARVITRQQRTDAVFCSVRCGLAARKGRHYRGVTGGVQTLARKHGWICHLCGLPIDPGIRWPDPSCPTVDHVIPVSRGGSDDPSNLALAHALCNIRKGNRT